MFEKVHCSWFQLSVHNTTIKHFILYHCSVSPRILYLISKRDSNPADHHKNHKTIKTTLKSVMTILYHLVSRYDSISHYSQYLPLWLVLPLFKNEITFISSPITSPLFHFYFITYQITLTQDETKNSIFDFKKALKPHKSSQSTLKDSDGQVRLVSLTFITCINSNPSSELDVP